MRNAALSGVALAVALLVAGSAPAVALAKTTQHLAWGRVTAVNTEARSVTVKIVDKTETFSVVQATRIREAGRKASFATLERGDDVRVKSARMNGSDVASSVRIVVAANTMPAKSARTW